MAGWVLSFLPSEKKKGRLAQQQTLPDLTLLSIVPNRLLSGMTPVGLQFYTSLAAAVIQMPILVYKIMPHLLDQAAIPMSSEMMWMLFLDGIFYHTQSVTAYYTMSLLSPVSQSVANTAKRAILIILSILWFSNAVTVWNVTGVFIVVFGVFAYNYARMNFPAQSK